MTRDKKLAEMIVHIASDMVGMEGGIAQISSFTERAKFANFEKRYGWMWRKGFLLNADGSVTDDIVKPDEVPEGAEFYTYYEGQVRVFQMICDHIASMLEIRGSLSGSDKILGIINAPTANTVVSGSQIDTTEILDNVTLGLRNSLIQLGDTLLKEKLGKYIFRLGEGTNDAIIQRFLDSNVSLLDAITLAEVHKDQRRAIYEANDPESGFSVKRYDVFQESSVLGKGLGDHFHTLTGSDTSELAEAFVIQEGSGILVIKLVPDGEEMRFKFKAGDIILLPKFVAHTLWFEGEANEVQPVARFTGFLPRPFDPQNMDLNTYILKNPYAQGTSE